MSERILIKVEEGKDRLPVSFVWKGKKYIVNRALMSSYWPGSGYMVTVTIEGMKGKHIIWLDGDDWYVEV